MLIGGPLAYHLMCRIAPPERLTQHAHPAAHQDGPPLQSMLAAYLPADAWADLAGKTVLDYGCGGGADMVELVRRGAAHVIGLEIRQWLLDAARRNAKAAGVTDRCTFTLRTPPALRVDAITCTNVMEHVEDPDGVLADMAGLLAPGGRVYLTFSPPWYHPYGGHLFSVFPWAHVLLTERAMMRWRRALTPGATVQRYRDCGLNQTSVGQFLRVLERSPLRAETLELIPIRPLCRLHNRLTRELLTSGVRCRLVKRDETHRLPVESRNLLRHCPGPRARKVAK